MKLINLYIYSAALLLTVAVNQGITEESSAVRHLQTRWAQANYQSEGKDQLAAFEELVHDADLMTANNPESAELWIWSGIIKSTYAGVKGGLGALGLAKKAKADLEKAMTIDADALDGSIYTSLGTLYANVPGWPIGFGDDEKAETLLLKAITVSPHGIDSNYFYGTFLSDQGRKGEASNYLLKAQQAPARPNRRLADNGRQLEISRALADLNGE